MGIRGPRKGEAFPGMAVQQAEIPPRWKMRRSPLLARLVLPGHSAVYRVHRERTRVEAARLLSIRCENVGSAQPGLALIAAFGARYVPKAGESTPYAEHVTIPVGICTNRLPKPGSAGIVGHDSPRAA